MIGRLAKATSPSRRDAGDLNFALVGLIAIVAIFTSFVVSVSWAISLKAKISSRENMAQEALDYALADAMYALNDEWGVITDANYDVGAAGAYDRAIPTASTPETADLSQFNATKRTSVGDTAGDQSGVTVDAKWWVDVYELSNETASAVDPGRIRAGNHIGDLYVTANVYAPSDGTIYATRSVKYSLYQMQVRAVQSASDGKGLAYITSPLSLFQYAVFGTDEVVDRGGSTQVTSWSPIATSGNVVFDNPQLSTTPNTPTGRRYDISMSLFGQGQCINYNASTGVADPLNDCGDTRTYNTGFEVVPDEQLTVSMLQYCNAGTAEDFIASEQASPSLVADDTTYCFRDLIIDEDVRLRTLGEGNGTVRIFVERNVIFRNGHSFVSDSGGSLATDASAPQVAIYTDSTNVTLQSNPSYFTKSTFWLYAPNATCDPGRIMDNPATAGIDESLARGKGQYVGAIVCQTVVLDHANQVSNRTPFAGLVEFGDAGFGSDLYPNNIWFINTESGESVARSEE